MKKKRICIDINSITPLFVYGNLYGVGRTTLELVNAISKIKDDFDFEVLLYSQNMKGYGGKKLNLPLHASHFYLPNRKKVNNILNKLSLKKKVLKYDLYHVPHNTDYVEDLFKTIFTIHDLIVYRYPEMWGLTDEDRDYHKYLADNCRAIITCSEASKNDIVHFWNIDPATVYVTPWGINRRVFSPMQQTSYINTLGIKKENYFFCASCNHPRKNLPFLLNTFREYKKTGGSHQLVLLNPKQEDLNSVSDLIDKKEIIICRNVNDQELTELYSNAKASIIVSLYEGFGLPVIESLACHTPVISAHNSSLIEAGGNVADYIYEFEEKILSEKMYKYEHLKKDVLINIEEVEKHLSNFTWKKCAYDTMNIYQKHL